LACTHQTADAADSSKPAKPPSSALNSTHENTSQHSGLPGNLLSLCHRVFQNKMQGSLNRQSLVDYLEVSVRQLTCWRLSGRVCVCHVGHQGGHKLQSGAPGAGRQNITGLAAPNSTGPNRNIAARRGLEQVVRTLAASMLVTPVIGIANQRAIGHLLALRHPARYRYAFRPPSSQGACC
jgi:hypothetical protein